MIPEESKRMSELVNQGDCCPRPGWVRMSIHPTTTDEEVHFIVNASHLLALHHEESIEDYDVDPIHSIITHKSDPADAQIKSYIDHALTNSFTNKPRFTIVDNLLK